MIPQLGHPCVENWCHAYEHRFVPIIIIVNCVFVNTLRYTEEVYFVNVTVNFPLIMGKIRGKSLKSSANSSINSLRTHYGTVDTSLMLIMYVPL